MHMKAILLFLLLFSISSLAAETIPTDGESSRDANGKQQAENIEGLLFPFPVLLNYTRSRGLTDVTVYDKNSRAVAEGSATFSQNKISITGERMQSGFYITPETGYFNRTVSVKDFSKKDDQKKSGIISGIITDPATGEVISKEDVYSLKYDAQFYSFFVDLRAGYQFASGAGDVRFTFNPYISGNAVEYRKTVFRFKTTGGTEEFSRPFDFSYGGSYGLGLSAGLFFPAARFGFNLNYDRRYFSKYELPSAVRFKESYYDSTFQVMRAREVSVKYSDIDANIFSVIIYFML